MTRMIFGIPYYETTGYYDSKPLVQSPNIEDALEIEDIKKKLTLFAEDLKKEITEHANREIERIKEHTGIGRDVWSGIIFWDIFM